MPEIFIGQYLFRRLKEIGIETIFGVPGDYELALLDQVEPEGLAWIGSPNELTGAYAADGYARVNGAGALVTTFGPGELSALCGIGGAYCEDVPVVHIVGYPPLSAQKSGKILHHTIGDLSYDHYERMSAEISCATTVLRDTATAASEIDRVLNAMLFHSKPGYIGISEDVAYTKVSDEYLKTPLVKVLGPSAPDAQAKAVADIIKALESAKAPIIMVDGRAARPNWAQYVDPLIETLKIPFFQTMLGKGVANEESPYFGGSYGGAGSWPDSVNPAIAESDCILWLGNYPSDFNTGIFSTQLEGKTIIDLQRFFVMINDVKYDARINFVLPALVEAFQSHPQLPQLPIEPVKVATLAVPQTIEHDWLWQRYSKFLRPGDLIITETGTSQAGINATLFPRGSQGWTQGIYGSIGYATGAAAGAAVAAKEEQTTTKTPNKKSSNRRLILITGEGSLQLTIQALSLLNRFGIPPVIFVLNNRGYTIERFFRGWKAGYNDVDQWNYPALSKAFAPDVSSPGVRGFRVQTGEELDALLSDAEFNAATYPQIVEMIMGVDDAPSWMKAVFALKEEKKKEEAEAR